MDKLLLIFDPSDISYVLPYSYDLRLRDIACQMVTFDEMPQRIETGTISPILIAFGSHTSMDKVSSLAESLRGRPIRIALTLLDSTATAISSRYDCRINAFVEDYDLTFEQVFRFVIGDMPEWLRVYCRPSQMRKPTGAAWWDKDEMLIADEHYNHIVKFNDIAASVILAGLDEPYHINLDRHLISISNLGYNSVIFGRLRGGSLSNLREIQEVNGVRLSRPHGVFQGKDYSIIADTDNHRVVWKAGHFRADDFVWQADVLSGARFPCGVFGDDLSIWIADTFHHRLVCINPVDGSIQKTFGGPGIDPGQMLFPTSICRWNKYIFVTDEQNRRIQVLKESTTGNLLVVDPAVAGGFINSPMGLHVNRTSKLLVTDRSKGCCWTIDLALIRGECHWEDVK